MGVYVVAAHEYQEMMSCQITISAGIVFRLAGGTRYLVVYILPYLPECVKGFLKKILVLKKNGR